MTAATENAFEDADSGCMIDIKREFQRITIITNYLLVSRVRVDTKLSM